jgi:hypothetical protein
MCVCICGHACWQVVCFSPLLLFTSCTHNLFTPCWLTVCRVFPYGAGQLSHLKRLRLVNMRLLPIAKEVPIKLPARGFCLEIECTWFPGPESTSQAVLAVQECTGDGSVRIGGAPSKQPSSPSAGNPASPVSHPRLLPPTLVLSIQYSGPSMDRERVQDAGARAQLGQFLGDVLAHVSAIAQAHPGTVEAVQAQLVAAECQVSRCSSMWNMAAVSVTGGGRAYACCSSRVIQWGLGRYHTAAWLRVGLPPAVQLPG